MVHRRRVVRRHRPGRRARPGALQRRPLHPRRRTAWHKHANGQLLHVTDGTGLTQVRGGDVVVIRAGDTIWCSPGEWHWHGAAPDHFMTHLAIWDSLREGQHGPETEWGEHVTEAEYAQQP
jgi:quercetin dioxygenase-like cupin family protein